MVGNCRVFFRLSVNMPTALLLSVFSYMACSSTYLITKPFSLIGNHIQAVQRALSPIRYDDSKRSLRSLVRYQEMLSISV